MFIRYPAKKKLTGNRFWKKIYVRISENSVVQLYNKIGDPDPFQELPLQPSYQCSEISAQQFDQFGKIFTLKLMYIFYKVNYYTIPQNFPQFLSKFSSKFFGILVLIFPIFSEFSPISSLIFPIFSEFSPIFGQNLD